MKKEVAIENLLVIAAVLQWQVDIHLKCVTVAHWTACFNNLNLRWRRQQGKRYLVLQEMFLRCLSS